METKFESVGEVTEPAAEPTLRVWAELCVVLAIAVIPDIFNAAAMLVIPDSRPMPPAYTALRYVIRSLAVSLPVLYIMGRSGKPWYFFGIRRPELVRDPLRAVAIFLIVTVVTACYWMLVPKETPQNLLESPKNGRLLFALMIGIPNGFSEELAMRGYLIPRLEQLLGTKWDGVFISAVLFASYHIYQGIAGAVLVFLIGLIFAGAFCMTRRLWPLVVVHSAANALSLWMF